MNKTESNKDENKKKERKHRVDNKTNSYISATTQKRENLGEK